MQIYGAIQIFVLNKRFLRKPVTFFRLASEGASANAFFISYPKSGRTWFRFILANYFSLIYGLGVKVDLHNMFTVVPNFDFNAIRGIPSFKAKNWPAVVPLIPVSHLPYDNMLFRRRRVIFMIRDPRDVMVSAYFHETRHKHRFSGGMLAFLQNRKLGLPTLVQYLNGWADALGKCENVVISYEELSRDAETETARVLRFIDCRIDEGVLKTAISAAGFEAMREIEVLAGIPGHDYDRNDSDSLRMRRGKAQGYTEHLSAAEISFIENYCFDNLNPAAKSLVKRPTQVGEFEPL